MNLLKPPKLSDAQIKRIRSSAKGEACTLQIFGTCNGDPSTTVYCHVSSEWNGRGIKSPEVSCGVFGCSNCHRQIDGVPFNDKDFYILRALQRTIKRMVETGVIEVK